MIGAVFGMLTVVEMGATIISPNGKHVKTCRCRCECGMVKVIRAGHLKNGATISCGCHARAIASRRATLRNPTHRMSLRPVYAVYRSMLARCSNPKNKAWHLYGGRGITVCDRWKTFEQFLADMGEPSAGMSLDRIDSNGNYEPSNCRWATMQTQQRNRRNNHLLTINGRSQPIAAWADEAGISATTLTKRIEAKWPEARLLSPTRTRN